MPVYSLRCHEAPVASRGSKDLLGCSHCIASTSSLQTNLDSNLIGSNLQRRRTENKEQSLITMKFERYGAV